MYGSINKGKHWAVKQQTVAVTHPSEVFVYWAPSFGVTIISGSIVVSSNLRRVKCFAQQLKQSVFSQIVILHI